MGFAFNRQGSDHGGSLRDPLSRFRYGPLLPNDAIAFGNNDLLPQSVRMQCGERYLPEAFFLQHAFPSFWSQPRTATHAQTFVLEYPPSLQQAEREMQKCAPV